LGRCKSPEHSSAIGYRATNRDDAYQAEVQDGLDDPPTGGAAAGEPEGEDREGGEVEDCGEVVEE